MTQQLIAASSVNKAVATPEAAGGLAHTKFLVNLADAAFTGITYAVADGIQIGVVPAGHKLVPWLCHAAIPILDSNGSPVGTGTIGTLALTTAVAPSFNFSTAQLLDGEDLSIATAEVGSDNADTPIYIFITHVLGTNAVTDTIMFDMVVRPWDSTVDGTSTS